MESENVSSKLRKPRKKMELVPAGFIVDTCKKLNITREEFATYVGLETHTIHRYVGAGQAPKWLRVAANGLVAEMMVAQAENTVNGGTHGAASAHSGKGGLPAVVPKGRSRPRKAEVTALAPVVRGVVSGVQYDPMTILVPKSSSSAVRALMGALGVAILPEREG